MSESENIVLYHADCPDGFTAAWVAHRALPHESTQFIPCKYNRETPAFPASSRVYLLDFSLPRSTMQHLHKRHGVENVILLDHHQTAASNLSGLPGCNIDQTRSGAMLAWDYFNDGMAPNLVAYVQDRDLWQWQLPGSRQVSAYIQTKEHTFADWYTLYSELEHHPEECITKGDAILAKDRQTVARLVKNASLHHIRQYEVPVVNSAVLQSEVGEALLVAYPDARFAAIYSDVHGVRRWSLRSRPDFDCSVIASQFNGGGHAQASGFSTIAPRVIR